MSRGGWTLKAYLTTWIPTTLLHKEWARLGKQLSPRSGLLHLYVFSSLFSALNCSALEIDLRYRLRLNTGWIDPFKVKDAIMKHNSARGANTMQFPIDKFARGANTMVKTIDSRWRLLNSNLYIYWTPSSILNCFLQRSSIKAITYWPSVTTGLFILFIYN